MFGKRLKELPPIKEAVATYMMRASENLRAQGSLCKKIRVGIRTGMFSPEEAKYANGVIVDLPYPTDDVRLLTKAAVDAFDRVFRTGFNYSKAGSDAAESLSARRVHRGSIRHHPVSRGD